MATLPSFHHPSAFNAGVSENATLIARERRKSLMLRAWIASGLFFMALPGTLLGFSNLMAISANHGLGTLPAAWMEGHGHAQMFGWIGSFILGIGFYSQPRAATRLPLFCYMLWTSGVAMRWFANIYGWHWRTLLPVSAGFELIAVILFLFAASHHKRPASTQANKSRPPIELWMVSVLIGTAALASAVIFNFVECVRLGLQGGLRSFPRALDQKYLVLLGWGFVVPVVWGFSARWLPSFLAISKPRVRLFRAAILLDVTGVLFGVAGFPKPATILFAFSAVVIGLALRFAERPHGLAITKGIHPSFATFARLPYAWLVIAALMSFWAAFADVHGGIWGASRHALTVGFAATMVFAIGPRILPHFAGFERIFSKRLMLISLLCLQIGCLLRVSSEPLAYEGIASFAWKVLPVSGTLELCGVLIFATNLALTFLFGRSAFSSNPSGQRAAA
jgi:uncharacterized protein involved in response to NO